MLPEPAAIATSLGKATAPHLLKLLKSNAQPWYDNFVATCTNIFTPHLIATVKRCEYIKNILYKDVPISLTSQYVHNEFLTDGKLVSDLDILKSAKVQPVRGVVVGHAGSGKSMFMKWLAITLCNDILTHQRIPIFLEVRTISEKLLDFSFEEIVYLAVSGDHSKASLEQFKAGLKAGVFILILDGFDEMPPIHRDKLVGHLRGLGPDYDAATILCSTRPDNKLQSLERFTVFNVKPMDLEQAKSVLQNVSFDPERREKFIKALEGGLYNTHRSFLSLPLLCIIMLIAYDDRADIPSLLHEFYQKVFTAMFDRHDASKGNYRRIRYTDLNEGEFETVLRRFCFATYGENRVRFTQGGLVERIVEAINHTLVASRVSAENFIQDCKESVSLLQNDGLEISFIHRSFQEYFSARYLMVYDGDRYREFLDSIAARGSGDSVLPMLYQMNSIAMTRKWILPSLASMIGRLQEVDLEDPDSMMLYLADRVEEIMINPEDCDGILFISRGGVTALIEDAILELLRPNYPDLYRGAFSGNVFDRGDHSFEEWCAEISISYPEHMRALMAEVVMNTRDLVKIKINYASKYWILFSNIPNLMHGYLDRLRVIHGQLEQRINREDNLTFKP